MSKEPSTDTGKEEELYASMLEDSAERVFSDHVQESVKSEDPDGILDYEECNKILTTAAEQNTDVDVKSMENIECEFTDKHHTEYKNIAPTASERKIKTDEEGVNVIEYEGDDFRQHPVNEYDSNKYLRIASSLADDFKHHSVHMLHCAKYTKLPLGVTEQDTEVDTEGLNVVKCEVHDFDGYTYQLQNTEVQEGSFDQQICGSVRAAESAAISMKLGNSRPVRKLEMVCTCSKLTISLRHKEVSHMS
jgi:hypothetical protein